jgi:hypothetical protein
MQNDIKEASKRLENYSKVPTSLNAKSVAVDSLNMGSDTDKVKKQTQFLKAIGSDIYIDETVKAIDQIIGEAILAQRSSVAQ